MTKEKSNTIKVKSIKKVSRKRFSKISIWTKLIVIVLFMAGFFYYDSSFSNTVKLLAVTENSEGEVVDGSIIKLTLKTKPGSGQTFVNLKTIGETDTQISIINSQKIACNLFSLDCDAYDFFYEFEGNAIVLKGPSASGAIAVLVAKTLNKEKISDDVAITGTLNSGGLISGVGGVSKKILTAENEGLKKVIVPIYSSYNSSDFNDIKVAEVLDVIDAYNEFNGNNYELEKIEIDRTNYENLMKELGDSMCARSLEINETINYDLIEFNSSNEDLLNRAKDSYNSSQVAKSISNYYSQGSFCYNANLNFRTLDIKLKNYSDEEFTENLEFVKNEIKRKLVEIESDEYKNKIKTINDFYVYLLINDRINEANDFLDDIELEKVDLLSELNISDVNESINFTVEDSASNKERNENLYSYAIERYYTVTLWERLIVNNGKNVRFDDDIINNACHRLNREISLKSEVLDTYGIGVFDSSINELNTFRAANKNKYLCIYKGLELSGRINTVLNSGTVGLDIQENYTKEIVDITKERIVLNSDNEFPLIPTIYQEYASDLFENGNYGSTLLYSNYALAYTDLNLYLEKDDYVKSVYRQTFEKLFDSFWFVLGILLIIAFTS